MTWAQTAVGRRVALAAVITILWTTAAVPTLATSEASAATEASANTVSSASSDALLPDRVVLLHGLGRSSWSMLRMEAALSRDGYETHNIGYPSTKHDIATLSEIVAEQIDACCSDRTVHFVTHSLGGILVRAILADGEYDNVGRVVMLAPPNQGSEIVDVLADQELFARGLGPSGSELGTDEASVPKQLEPVDFELGVITGDRTINPLFSWWIPGEDDGKVSVDSARVEGMVDFLVLPYTHTFIMNATEVIEQTKHFFEHGEFEAVEESTSGR